MYYSAGTYESFAHPEKPKDVDKKSAYIIGTGLAGLTAALRGHETRLVRQGFTIEVDVVRIETHDIIERRR